MEGERVAPVEIACYGIVDFAFDILGVVDAEDIVGSVVALGSVERRDGIKKVPAGKLMCG